MRVMRRVRRAGRVGSIDRAQGSRSMRLTGAGLFTLLFAEAVRAPRLGMIVPRVMLSGALRTKDLARVTVDTTLQPKNITFPTDAKLLHANEVGPGHPRPPGG